MSINYVTDNFTIEYAVYAPKLDLYASATGYGSRIRTAYKVKLTTSTRIYRVYAICYSNAASLYITVLGKRYFLTDADISTNKK